MIRDLEEKDPALTGLTGELVNNSTYIVSKGLEEGLASTPVPGDRTHVYIAGGFFTTESPGKPPCRMRYNTNQQKFILEFP